MATKQDITRTKAQRTPATIAPLARTPVEALMAEIEAREDVQAMLADGVACRRSIRTQEPDSPVLDAAIERLLQAQERAARLLWEDDAVRHFFAPPERLFAEVGWILAALDTGETPPWDFGRVAAVLPEQQSRFEVHVGGCVWVLNGASDKEVSALFPYIRWMHAQANGRAVNLRKSPGDDELTSAEFYDRLDSGIVTCSRMKLTLENLANSAGLSRKTLSKYLEKYGPPWWMLKKERTRAKCEARGWNRVRS